MNIANFSEYLQNPSLLYQISYEELKTLIVQYPYSQNLRYLIAQKSNMENKPDYEHFLRSAAIISTDRVHLYHILKMQKTEAAVADNFILEEEALELKDLNVLDLNQAPLESLEHLVSDTNSPEQASIFNTFPELSPEAKSDIESAPLVEAEEIILPTLEEEAALANLLEADINETTTEEAAIEQLINETANTENLATSIAELLTNKETSEDIGEVSLASLFETEVPAETPTKAEIDETTESIKFRPNITSIHQLLGEEDLPKRRKITKALRPLDRRHFKGNKQKAYQKITTIEQPNANSNAVEAVPSIIAANNKDTEKPLTFQTAAEIPQANIATSPIPSEALANAIPVNPGYDEEQIETYADKSIEETADIASETYASLLVRQNQHTKAIQVYERLKLIFPEKSTFFAEQIESLEQKL